MLDRWGHKRLQAEVTRGVVGGNAGNVVELTGLRNLRLWRENDGLGCFFGLSLPARNGQGNVLRIADEFLHPDPHLSGGLVRVKAEANHFAVI